MLSPKLLDALRVYWHGLKRKPTDRSIAAIDRGDTGFAISHETCCGRETLKPVDFRVDI